MSDEIYEARESFATELDGEQISVSAGERIREGHPLIVANPARFKPLHIKYEVEQATAAPSEKRRVGRPSKPKADA
jgi:hypothetical protein